MPINSFTDNVGNLVEKIESFIFKNKKLAEKYGSIMPDDYVDEMDYLRRTVLSSCEKIKLQLISLDYDQIQEINKIINK